MTWRTVEQEKELVAKMWWLPVKLRSRRYRERASYQCYCAYCRSGKKKRSLIQAQVVQGELGDFKC